MDEIISLVEMNDDIVKTTEKEENLIPHCMVINSDEIENLIVLIYCFENVTILTLAYVSSHISVQFSLPNPKKKYYYCN